MSNPDPVQNVLDRLEGVKQAGDGQYMARCPAHDDARASLSVGRGKDGRALVHCQAGCARGDVLQAIGLNDSDLFPPDAAGKLAPRRPKPPLLPPAAAKRIVTAYPYRSAAGKVLYEVVRYEPKDFRQRRPDGKDWTWNMNGVPRVLYRLPELLAADGNAWVFIVEGEKDADSLTALGLIATTNPGGAGKWGKMADDSALHGRRVAIIPDKDKPDAKGRVTGMDHAQNVAACLHGKAAVVKIIDLPDMPPKDDGRPRKDVSDWIEWLDGKTAEDLAAALVGMAEAAQEWTAAPVKSLESEPVTVCLADVTPTPVKWFWPSRIALGKLTLIVGDPGLGKSFITLDMAARVSRGMAWPDCPAVYNTPGGVVLLSAEDDLGDTIRPRLDAAGADLLRIKALTTIKRFAPALGKDVFEPFSLTKYLPALERTIESVSDCRLVVIDPVSAYLGGTDSHKNADVRGMLAPLSELAARHGVAIIAVNHLRKGEGPAMYRAMGSLAFIAAARAAYCVSKDKDDPTGKRRLFLPIKNNLGNDRDGLAYCLDDTFSANGQPVVKWEATPVSISADDALSEDGGRGEEDPSELEEAKTWLADMLAAAPMLAKDVLAQSRQNGISKRTLYRAKKALNVTTTKKGFDTGWAWRLPGTPDTPAPAAVEGSQVEEAHISRQETLATFDGVGNLRQKPQDSEASLTPPGG